ncbi:hypothetical protein I317_07496 [Kwoniella heveanensis CBS 569]|uniref:Uncharacterized protein n=1 Tax=Kwoniella heveanensis BCC8398 TaxID=1296120 RepID=A0A1B9GPW3_9TREE|nr:hypothetical protein I316_05376 [Kwoniella heveanensis BCC8398]OCF38711.1 hypothetical protein I317_07496 [Kwoniella heveanensis CBS 569]
MRSPISLLYAVYLTLLSMTVALPITLLPRSLLDHYLSHRLGGSSSRDNLKSHLLYYTTANQSDAVEGAPRVIECGTVTTTSPNGARGDVFASGLLVQAPLDERASRPTFSDKDAWDAASWIWG